MATKTYCDKCGKQIAGLSKWFAELRRTMNWELCATCDLELHQITDAWKRGDLRAEDVIELIEGKDTEK